MFLLYPGENVSKQGRKVHAVYIFLIIVYRKKGGLVASQYTIAEGKLDANVDTITNEGHICCLCKRHGGFTWRLISNGFCKQQSRTHAM